MSTPGGYPRFIEHIEHSLGEIQHVEGPEVDGANRGYALVYTLIPDPGVASVITNGVRFQKIASLLPEEFVLSLQEDQEHIARFLVDTVASLAISGGRGLEYDQVMKHDQPIIKNTQIHGLLASQSPFFGDEFDLYLDNGQPTLQIITLLPVTAAEAEYAEKSDAESMYNVWREHRTNLLDIFRESAI